MSMRPEAGSRPVYRPGRPCRCCCEALYFTTYRHIWQATRGPVREGMRLLDQHRFADAASAYTRAVERNPRDAKSYYKRAVANAMVDRQDAIGAAF